MKLLGYIISACIIFLMHSCDPCIGYASESAPFSTIDFSIDSSFSAAEKDTLILKQKGIKQIKAKDSLNYIWLNYYITDTFILNNNKQYEHTVKSKVYEQQLSITFNRNESNNKPTDTAWIYFDKYQYELIGLQEKVERHGKCNTERTILESHIWVNNFEADLLKNSHNSNIFKIENGSLILTK